MTHGTSGLPAQPGDAARIRHPLLRAGVVPLGIGALIALVMVKPHTAAWLPLSAGGVGAWPGWTPGHIGRPRWDRLLIGLAGIAVLVILTISQLIVLSHLFSVDSPIFRVYYEAAQAGLSRGWGHIYDKDAYSVLPYLNPPPLAWVVSLLSFLPFRWAYVTWTAVQAAGLLVTVLLLVPGPALRRTLCVLLGVSLFAQVAVGGFGEPVVLVGLGLVLCWRLLRSGRELLAGLALAIIAVKPHLALLVPIALLCAGWWRTFLTWAMITLILAAVSMAQLGVHGLPQYLDLLRVYGSPESQRVFAVGGVLGTGWPVIVLQGGLAFFTLAVAYRAGKTSVTVPVVSGILGSVLVAPYFHWYDLYVVVLAAGLLWVSWPSRTVAASLIAMFVLTSPGLFGNQPRLHAGLWFTLELFWLLLLLVSWRPKQVWPAAA